MPTSQTMVVKNKKGEEMVVTKELVVEQVSKPIHGFWQFLTQKEIMFLALGVIIADSVKTVVNALVDGIIRPFIALFTPGTGDLQKAWVITVHGSQFKIGDVVSALLQMGILFFLLYFVVVVLLRQQKAFEENLGIQSKNNLQLQKISKKK